MTTTRATTVDGLALPGARRLQLAGRPLVMGILNITPDSFSDGGRWIDPTAAVDWALQMIEQGADVIDLGAESTRPGGGVYGDGAAPVPGEVELERLLPVLEELRSRTDIPLSVDTRKGDVALAALDAGADMINDISALGDPALARAVAEAGCPIVLMHSRGEIPTMQRGIVFGDLVAEIIADLRLAIDRSLAAGIDQERIIVDPGIGFGKTANQNLLLLRRLDELHVLGCPVLIGASRKSFLGHVTGAAVGERLAGGLAAAGWAARHGAAVVRVHDVGETVQYLRVYQAIAEAAAKVPGAASDHSGEDRP